MVKESRHAQQCMQIIKRTLQKNVIHLRFFLKFLYISPHDYRKLLLLDLNMNHKFRY